MKTGYFCFKLQVNAADLKIPAHKIIILKPLCLIIMPKTLNTGYCQWLITATLMQPFIFWAAANFCPTDWPFNSNNKWLQFHFWCILTTHILTYAKPQKVTIKNIFFLDVTPCSLAEVSSG
jgi:hypothetical protein